MRKAEQFFKRETENFVSQIDTEYFVVIWRKTEFRSALLDIGIRVVRK